MRQENKFSPKELYKILEGTLKKHLKKKPGLTHFWGVGTISSQENPLANIFSYNSLSICGGLLLTVSIGALYVAYKQGKEISELKKEMELGEIEHDNTMTDVSNQFHLLETKYHQNQKELLEFQDAMFQVKTALIEHRYEVAKEIVHRLIE